jgi:hypothetical protein
MSPDALATYETTRAVVYAVLIVAAYLLPAIVAALRRHHQAAAIATLNVILGWTGLLWVAALVWAMTAVRST